MYGGSSKLGRAGGGGRGAGAKRLSSSLPLPPHNRPSGRPSLGSGGGGSSSNPRNSSATPSSSSQAVEESFSLVPGNNPLSFGMMIRLAPELVEEIKRTEAQGGTPRIKFDSNASNSSGNVIDVGGKEFRFTWSQEFGGLFDIYEKRKSGEDANGILVESGSAWRKLNVQRVLDESKTNHFKKLSEEAERKSKSRKAIVLESGNPSMKSQIKALAAVETNTWRFKHKKEPPFKKQRNESSQGGPPSRSAYKPGQSSTTTTKIRYSSSPLPSPPEQCGGPTSPFGVANAARNLSEEDVRPLEAIRDPFASSIEKEVPPKTTGAVRETLVHKSNIGAKPTDLENVLITLLMENPKGISIKALEKAVGDKTPNSIKKIEPILKRVAVYQAPGKYILKPGVESEGSNKHSPKTGSSPKDNLQQTPAREEGHDQDPAPEPRFKENVHTDMLEGQEQLNCKPVKESNEYEQINVQQSSPDQFGDKKDSDNSEGHAARSSDSGSDSDSESDNSDSESDSRSRSKSPAESGKSSSDSESEPSSNSKEGSDVEVDIMTSDDDKETKLKLQATELGFSKSPAALRTPDDRVVQSSNDEKEAGHESDAIDVENDIPDEERETRTSILNSVPEREGVSPFEETNKSLSPDSDEIRERQDFIGSLFDDTEHTVKNSYRQDHSDSSERMSRGKSKRGFDLEHFDEKTDNVKRLKCEIQPAVSVGWDLQPQGSHRVSPGRITRDSFKDPTSQVTHKNEREENDDFGSHKGYTPPISGKSNSDIKPTNRRPFGQSGWSKASDTAERPEKHNESLGPGHKYRGNGFHADESFSAQKEKLRADAQNEEANNTNEKKVPRNLRKDGVGGKQGEIVVNVRDGRKGSSQQVGSFSKDSAVNEKGRILHRELSDWELGELREPIPEETPVKNKFERKSSFNQLENKAKTSDKWGLDVTMGKPIKTGNSELGRRSPPQASKRFPNSLEVLQKKRNPEEQVEDLTRSNRRTMHQFEKPTTSNAKLRQNEVVVNQGNGLEGHGEISRKAPESSAEQHDNRKGSVFPSSKESKRQAFNAMREVTDGQKESVLEDVNNNSDPKRRDSSSDENSCSYSKYEKDDPEFKGRIKNFSQYEEYVQEYRDKYDCYCSLNKILESYRTEFQKLGKDLQSAKGHDTERYFNLVEQLRESYRQCGTRHKRLKKIFMVLHEELKHLKQRIKEFAFSFLKDCRDPFWTD